MKLLLVCMLALLMAVPAMFIYQIVYDRSERAQEAIEQVGQRYGGPQTLMGPTLFVPYSIETTDEEGNSVQATRYAQIHAETGSASGNMSAETKTSGIHEIPIYSADVSFQAEFSRQRVLDVLPEEALLDWSEVHMLIGLTNPRATTGTMQAELNGTPLLVEPSFSQSSGITLSRDHRYLISALPGQSEDQDRFWINARISFTGAERISIAPFARDSVIELRSDWDDPRFEGVFQQTLYQPHAEGNGFTARWEVPYQARRIAGFRTDVSSRGLMWTDQVIGVRLVMAMTPYQSVERALKYSVLFIGFVFLAYFLMEITSNKRAHAAQYILVGLAQCMFFLLLLALSEKIGFDLAFLFAAMMTVLMTAFYAMSVFKSRLYGLRAVGIFTLVYTTIFVLMRMEDFAMLAGAFSGFLAIGATMYFTRDIDWYGLTEPAEAG
ncbi:cell envelope integrity protein CreD [Ponticaulis sp.]|uniref:cell envelope integrity protein CreD n=1 Tax=Ponticaulis sp. TaxID=2020902 RepID=UPI00261CA53D|nr:cell envelope integrity protein CreD [Ponticaulis sp.]MDF1679569.1 cell envelope integrity protein CreD [Ponticaulis sp.]